MENFNMKQWLMENKSGMYSKVDEMNPAALGAPQAVADQEMQQQDDLNGDMVDNVSMDTVAEARSSHTIVDLEEEPFFILGKEYLVSGEVDVTVTSDFEETVIDDAEIKIKEIYVENGNEYIEVKDPVKLKMLEDLLNTDKELHYKLKGAVADKDFGDPADDIDDYEPEMDEQIGVGYVSKTKSPEDKPFFPGS